jgi:protein-S-isoprenylcysteine O-methyltransferase Ste14
MMRATEFEFRNRAAVFGVIYGVTFSMLWFDHVPTGIRVGEWLAARMGWYGSNGDHLVFGVGAALMAVGGVWRTWGSSYLGMETVHDKAVHVEALHADGPYRYVRNPLYFGNVLMTIGMGLLAPRYAYPVQALLIILFLYRLIGREEAELSASQGEPYRAFMRAVPRLFPAVTPRIAGSGRKPDWKTGFATEAWYWSFTLGIAIFAATFKILWFYAGMVAAPFAGMAAEKFLKSGKASGANA